MGEFVKGLTASVPIVLAYIPVGLAFGSSAVASGLSPGEAILCSVLVFAGSAQFALLLYTGAMAIAIPLLLNVRHVIYAQILPEIVEIRRKPLTAFGLTDEVFALSFNASSERFVWGLEVGAYVSWIAGTALGAVAANAVGSPEAFSFAAVAMFFLLLLPRLERRKAVAVGTIASIPFHLAGYTSLGIIAAALAVVVLRD